MGTNSLSDGGTVYHSERVIVHEDYDRYRFQHDIGLIRVSEKIEFTETVQPIPVSVNDNFKREYPAKLSGWGSTWVGSALPDKLQELELMVITMAKCKDYHEVVSEGHICTLTKIGEGACHGDSGGPLTAEGQLIGLVSFGRPCARGHPDVFTRVSFYVDWIHETVQKN
ncbi:serine protease, partial [Staphylococcus haemolyticus]|uniref:serine protease n=1 Tax=Staphylococcus haemolyticus TaxID=1283 RepID=UPI002286A222